MPRSFSSLATGESAQIGRAREDIYTRPLLCFQGLVDVPKAILAKAVGPKAAKQVVEKVKTRAPDQTLAAATGN